MATVPHPLTTHYPYDVEEHRLFEQAFDPEARNELIAEDLFAGRSVCGVIIAIVVGGLVLGLLGVLLAS